MGSGFHSDRIMADMLRSIDFYSANAEPPKSIFSCQAASPNSPAMAHRPKPRKAPVRPIEPIDPEGWDKDPGRPLGLRLLALLGALSFLALGVGSLLPILQRQAPIPQDNGTKNQPLT